MTETDDPEASARISWAGTATLLLRLGRGDDALTVLTDPAFDPPGTTQRLFGLPGLSYTRRLPATLAPGDLPPLDLVLLSHDQHLDNFDATGRRVAAGAARLLTTRPAAKRLTRNGFPQARGLRRWETATVRQGGLTLTVTATPARHGPPLSRPFVGATTGFLLEWTGMTCGPLWISGDTVWHRALRPLAQRGIGIAVIHAGAATLPLTAPLRHTMNGNDAARAARVIHPAAVCPIHVEGWSHFRESPADFDAALQRHAPDLHRHWLPPGVDVDLADASDTAPAPSRIDATRGQK
jgi:L-ascorbate metabolism protein UlaG (beta-lactamase superfamily)